MQSVFLQKDNRPDDEQLKSALGKSYTWWQQLEKKTLMFDPKATCEWKFSGAKFGWSYRISDKKRVLVYLLPRNRFFKIAFVFGEKAFREIMASSIHNSIKEELLAAKTNAEGRGIRIPVTDKSLLADLFELIRIKTEN